ncbi:MAG TPA: carboxylating nicotinate-nucleotide diphosphorylase [Candidatus Pullichristensenella stercorigallinarum]|uniref:Probable nicotinate-nucleotide pyrophosphorylase [carboxylating] n=1 Tax=Candidatus Pullichristensenella stercorigallinarum TaxID=2840909 RepID=A0A9D0ZKA6_9FIRM|nr:carboxylating nicotinate-nucleotide diphosphorylase [Candidatus Pullichristensenella stercorigallinarum]
MFCSLSPFALDGILENALREDVGTGDITTLSTISPDRTVTGKYIAKESGVICGLDVVRRVFALLDPSIVLEARIQDGGAVQKGDIVAIVRGNARNVLTGERVGLNLLQHMSGVATQTARAVAAVVGTKAKIVDTRKATPGLRILDKYAVRAGGGGNHRFNLADGILIKDNHIVAAGGIANAVRAARENAPHVLKIEVEVENFAQLDEALSAGADIIMLDNMTIEDMRRAVETVNGRALTEASGNMGDKTPEQLRAVAETGVDFISIGALTHSVRALDISLKFVLE